MMDRAKMDKLDRVLAAEEELVPSSGFAASVMDRVRQEAVAPEPIPFPWKRALPGMILAAIGLLWCLVKLVQGGSALFATPIRIPLHPAAVISPSLAGAGWVAAALGLSLLSWLFARRLIGRGDLV